MEAVIGWAEVGDRVRQARAVAQLTQGDVARRLGIDRTAVGRIEAGERGVSALELFALAELFEVPLGYFVRAARQEVVSRRVAVSDDPVAADRAHWRIDVALDTHMHDTLLLLEQGLLDHSRVESLPDAESLPPDVLARQARDRLRLGDEPVGDLAEVLEAFSLYLLVIDQDVDGASMLVDGHAGVAVIGGGRDPGRRRFTAAHELGHHLLGDAYTVDVGTSNEEREQRINAFAMEFLLPRSVLVDRWPDSADEQGVRRFLVEVAANYRVSWSAVVGAARDVGKLDAAAARHARAQRPVDGEFLSVLGRKPREDLAVGTTGSRWRRAVLAAYERGFITGSRTVELLRGAIQADQLPMIQSTDEL